jgi:hypothetical protein
MSLPCIKQNVMSETNHRCQGSNVNGLEISKGEPERGKDVTLTHPSYQNLRAQREAFTLRVSCSLKEAAGFLRKKSRGHYRYKFISIGLDLSYGS